MASVLDLVKHYQGAIEKYPHDEQKVSLNFTQPFSVISLYVKVSSVSLALLR